MMNLIEHNNWKEFLFTEIFDIQKGFYNKKPPCFEEGNIPFIGASDSNNGITGFTDYGTIKANSKIGYGKNEPIDRKIFKGNAICVTNNGSVGYAYYQVSDFTCTHDVNPLYLLNHELNRYIAMFLIACIEKQRVCFAYARKWRPKRMVNSRIMLPATIEGTPDWQFMEAYMKQQEQAILKPTIERLCKQLITNGLTGGGKLSNLTWKEFVFGEEFSITATGSGIDKNKLITGEGDTPYITRTDCLNGIDGFIPEQASKYCMDEGNVITIGLDTQTVFYQPKAFYTGQNIQIIRHPQLDKYNAMFIIVAIQKLVERFSWGSYGATLTRLRKSRIYLPANKDGQPDFAFMSSFMQQVEQDILGTTLSYFADKQQITPHANDRINWKTFLIRDVLTISAGKRLTKADMQIGNRPFIGATDSYINNGITEWVNNTNESIDQNLLGVNYNGSVGEVFYHPYECIFSDDVKRLHLKDLPDSKYIMLFIKTAIVQQKVKYAYGYKFNEQRMLKQPIMLPFTSDGTPDWKYMDSYMRHIESQQILKYLQHYKTCSCS
jgi:restriction endonuclease S subunit